VLDSLLNSSSTIPLFKEEKWDRRRTPERVVRGFQ